MPLFKKKNPEDTLSFKVKMAERISAHRIRIVSERRDTDDMIIGHGGDFTVKDGLFTVSSGGVPVFRCKISEMKASELLSMEGAIIDGYDLLENRERRIIVYYVYYRET